MSKQVTYNMQGDCAAFINKNVTNLLILHKA